MKISLRRAAALQNSIRDALHSIPCDFTVRLNEFQDSELVISAKQAELAENLQRRSKLTQVLYDIRTAVGRANHEAGVNQLLAQVARLDREIQDHQILAGGSARQPQEVISGQLRKIREDKGERRAVYGYDATVETTVLTTEVIADHRAQVQNLRRQRQNLQDEILELNVRTEILLSDEAVNILKNQNLV